MRLTKSLESTIALAVTPFHLERIRIIDTEDFTGVKRKTREEFAKQGKQVSEDFLDEGILALKQYYAVALLDPQNEHAVSDEIDPFWHAHILHTRRYADFCERVYGQFIHHEPLDHGSNLDVRHVARLYEHTATMYRKMFAYINEHFYPHQVADVRLVCTHYEVTAQAVREQALFERVELLAA